jgi:hypothetical protein
LDNAGFYHRYDINSIDIPRNKDCSRCSNCSCLVDKLTEEEKVISDEVYKLLKYHKNNLKKFSGNYIYREDPRLLNLRSNEKVALKDAKKMSFRIGRLGQEQATIFNGQVKKAVTNEALTPVEPGEFDGYPTRFSPTVYAFSGKLESTPIRFCADSSRDDFSDSTSFNLLTMKGFGGNSLSRIMLLLRCNLFCSITDLSSAYHLVALGKMEHALRRVWLPFDRHGELAWGKPECEVSWRVFAWHIN